MLKMERTGNLDNKSLSEKNIDLKAEFLESKAKSQRTARRIEILAPCRGPDTIGAALKYGADAVYLGVKDFSARRQARNFTFEELETAVKECHSYRVKIFLTLNTLIFDSEIEKLKKTINIAAACGIDAIIIQDLSILNMIKECYPNLAVHASTQMSITSVSGAKMAKELGFKRIVLARELSFEEIKEIAGSVDIETEVFIHGALCVSLSGQCYMSAVIGGRSGNRGFCAQPCRLPASRATSCGQVLMHKTSSFSKRNFLAGQGTHVLSLKDLSIINRIKELDSVGITSVKIEGRMKRSEYVAAAVNACYFAREGKEPDINILRAAFSRSGFTSGYYDNDYSKMSGIRLEEDKQAFSNFNILKLKEIRKIKG